MASRSDISLLLAPEISFFTPLYFVHLIYSDLKKIKPPKRFSMLSDLYAFSECMGKYLMHFDQRSSFFFHLLKHGFRVGIFNHLLLLFQQSVSFAFLNPPPNCLYMNYSSDKFTLHFLVCFEKATIFHISYANSD